MIIVVIVRDIMYKSIVGHSGEAFWSFLAYLILQVGIPIVTKRLQLSQAVLSSVFSQLLNYRSNESNSATRRSTGRK